MSAFVVDVTAAAGPDPAAFWLPRLRTGGATQVPRWTTSDAPAGAPGPSTATVTVDVPVSLRERTDLLVHDEGFDVRTVLVAAHARVVAALVGESAVVVGVGAAPLHVETATSSWARLLRAVDADVRAVLAHPLEDLAALAADAGVVPPTWETAVGADAVVDRAWSVALTAAGLQVTHRRDVLDAEAARRVAGYHVAAWQAAVTDPMAVPGAADLLSPDELALQLRGMSGAVRPLPDVRAHRLIERRVREHPDAVAAVCGADEVTYGELNRRANRVARALVARGVEREDVVAVVTERNLDWLVGVLAVFKAGATYLPIEPHFPAQRIATTLRRAGCVLALTEAASRTNLDAAIVAGSNRPAVLLFDTALAEAHPEHDLDVEVDADQRAYIYFTSGSTGEPKGAMCEHAGMLNHLLAKIEDLGIGEGDVVAQTAPQCFDISLWQLIAALLVGGRTAIVEQAEVLDVERMVEGLAARRVAVLQVVPSYLEVVMTYLERHARPLPDLRVVSVTGEAVKHELVERWFAVRPAVALVNAYGLTETSDDTNHAVMRTAPPGARVPLGPPVRNVTVYVVDPDLRPVPLGAPGEIVFSGVCVGRGYVNDPVRTAAVFGDDPYVPGARSYRSGDFGRWRPDGALEFLGRRDTQLKIAGFRIEIGEIENRLLGAPGVRDACVVVRGGAGDSRHLVGFYDSEAPLDPEALHRHLADALPHYMVPATLHHRHPLPLSGNGKVDRAALTALAADLDDRAAATRTRRELTTASQRRVAAAWASALGVAVDELGPDDDFFARGGTSLAAVKVVIRLDRAVTLRDVTGHPVLGDLAAVLDGDADTATGLLQPLGDHRGPAGATAVVCLPHAGGNAVNFHPLAQRLAAAVPQARVWAVELPGHDLTRAREPFAELPDVVERLARELTALPCREVVLWGQSAGAVTAIALAATLQRQGKPVRHVFLGSQFAGDADSRRAALDTVAARDDAALGAALAEGDQPGGDPTATRLRLEHAGAAFRHDVTAACGWLLHAFDAPPTARVTAPVTVVVAADDPGAADALIRHEEWTVFAENVDLVVLPEGGHHLVRTAPDACAGVVADVLAGTGATTAAVTS